VCVSYRNSLVVVCVSYRNSLVVVCVSYRNSLVVVCVLYRNSLVVVCVSYDLVESMMSALRGFHYCCRGMVCIAISLLV